MVVLSKDSYTEMGWTYVRYIKENQVMNFPIEPMKDSADIVYLPNNEENCKEAITYIKSQEWNRDLKYQQADYKLEVIPISKAVPQQGTLEDTKGAKEFHSLAMFDPGFDLPKEEVHKLWCTLERRFAEAAEGKVTIYAGSVVEGSVFDQISIPTLMKNEKVTVMFVDRQ